LNAFSGLQKLGPFPPGETNPNPHEKTLRPLLLRARRSRLRFNPKPRYGFDGRTAR
jgi:hypothetical protein